MVCPCCGGGPGFGPWGRAYGPPPWVWRAWWEGPPRFGETLPGPARAAHKERLEALKKDLEAQLADINEELGKL